jgi:hypothetical protein
MADDQLIQKLGQFGAAGREVMRAFTERGPLSAVRTTPAGASVCSAGRCRSPKVHIASATRLQSTIGTVVSFGPTPAAQRRPEVLGNGRPDRRGRPSGARPGVFRF